MRENFIRDEKKVTLVRVYIFVIYFFSNECEEISGRFAKASENHLVLL